MDDVAATQTHLAWDAMQVLVPTLFPNPNEGLVSGGAGAGARVRWG